MDLMALIYFLVNNGIGFTYENTNNHVIRVCGEPEEIVGFNGEKRKYTPYLRISHFDIVHGNTKVAYVRDNGICEWRSEERIMEDILKLTKKGE